MSESESVSETEFALDDIVWQLSLETQNSMHNVVLDFSTMVKVSSF